MSPMSWITLNFLSYLMVMETLIITFFPNFSTKAENFPPMLMAKMMTWKW